MNGQVTPELWKKLSEILPEARRLPADQRRRFLVEACGEDGELLAEAESLLAHEHVQVPLLDHPLLTKSRARRSRRGGPSREGQSIGPFEILEKIGDGGMGTVYRARRKEGYAQDVALKVIRYAESELEWRFQQERQILANLEHPNIAHILQGGTTDDGRPYFAMELIEGLPIDRYCHRKRLPIRERLELFLQVCSALQFSHRNLVVHRDLKPGNILVTEEGGADDGARVKVVDFGIAKRLGAPAEDGTTRTDGQPFTTRFASPEQLRDLPITTACDIYSLGTVLYGLLTGRYPYRPPDSGMLALVSSICEAEPIRPSRAWDEPSSQEPDSPARAAELYGAELCGAELCGHRRQLAGDLDSIVLKALAKEPEDRYGSVQAMADDIRRHLEGRPVLAREGTFFYLAWRLLSRHRWALMVLVLFLASSMVVALLWRRAEDERDRTARTVETLEELLGVYDPDRIAPNSSPEEYLRQFKEGLEEKLADEPRILAEMLGGPLARAYRGWGLDDEARTLLDRALELARSVHRGDHPELASLLHGQGDMLIRLGHPELAEIRLEEALGMKERLGVPEGEKVRTLSDLAAIHTLLGHYSEAETLYRQVLEIRRRIHEEDHPHVATSLRHLANLHYLGGRFDSAESLLREALGLLLVFEAEKPTRVALVRGSLGRVLSEQGRFDEAESELSQALELRRERLGENHLHTAATRRDLAELFLRRGEIATAEVLLLKAQAVYRRVEPPEDWSLAELESLLGTILVSRGRYSEAEPCLVDGYRAIADARGEASLHARKARQRIEAWRAALTAEQQPRPGAGTRPSPPPDPGPGRSTNRSRR